MDQLEVAPKMEKKKRRTPQKRMNRCCVDGCWTDQRVHPELMFYCIPTPPERRKAWLTNIRLSGNLGIDYSKLHVCSNHFEQKCISNRKRLRKAAVPTLCLPRGDKVGEAVEDNLATTSSHAHTAPDNTQQQQNELVAVKQEPECLTVFVLEDEEEQQPSTSHDRYIYVDYVPADDQPKNKNKSPKKVYTIDFKMTALKLYFTSPDSYRVLRNSLKLPPISTLYRLCIPKTTELNQDVLDALKMKVGGMSTAHRQCVVCIGTMNLSPNIQYDAKADKIMGFHEVDGIQRLEPASTALIVMVRGLFHNWKQAVAFAFLSTYQNYAHVKTFIDDIIIRLFSLGLSVRALMTDDDTDSITAADGRIQNSKNPYITINNNKIYYMYDPLHLMKQIRDTMLTHNFVFYSGMIAKWQHILECYQHDHRKQNLRLAPKLSFNHVRPVKDALDELTVTADVFSTETATAVAAYVDMKVLPAAAKDTVQWIVTMNKLIEMFNFSSSNRPDGDSPAFNGAATQVDFLVEMLSMFLKLSMIPADVAKPQKAEKIRTPFSLNVRVTINALLLLYGDMKTEGCWFPVVGLTRDCLMEFFTKVREKYGVHTTTKQVVTCINKIPIFSIFKYSCKKRCKNDLETFMLHARQLADIDVYEHERAEPFVDACAGVSAEFSLIELPTENRLDHFALYLLHKAYQRHKACVGMQTLASFYEGIKNDALYIAVRPGDDGIRNAVPREFVEFIEVLEIKFKDYFNENRLTRSVSGLLSFLQKVTFEMPCTCFPLDYVKQIYLRCRLILVLKYNNMLFKNSENKPQFVVNSL